MYNIRSIISTAKIQGIQKIKLNNDIEGSLKLLKENIIMYYNQKYENQKLHNRPKQ